MKKLFILVPAVLLTAIAHSAAPSTVQVALSKGAKGMRYIEIPVNLNTETFPNLLQKIYNNKAYLGYTDGEGEITSLTLMKGHDWKGGASEHINDPSKLRDAGVHDGALLAAMISDVPSSKVTVALSKGVQGVRRIEIPVNLNTETFPSLLQKIYNNKAYHSYTEGKGKITDLTLMKGYGEGSEHAGDLSKLRDAGVGNGAYFVATISE